jgi:LmbE family N-acetylglucosaminyl deacetylase
LKLIRQWKADIVLTHRPNDYHPDHRYTGILVQDTAHIVTVPMNCPDVPHLPRNPVYVYFQDRFEKPAPFKPDIVVAIDDVIEKKLQAMLAMESQFIEGGVSGNEAMVPKTEAEWAQSRQRVRDRFTKRFADVADNYRKELIALYGEEKGKKIRYAEAFEICEYGHQPNAEEIKRFFPFLGN